MKEIFVFGSNLRGIHGKGAALYAKQHHGAIQGRPIGLHGSSYAIPTKETPYKSLPLIIINKFVADFLIFAKEHPELIFNVTPIGCGLAGYKVSDIAPMFKLALTLPNVNLDQKLRDYLTN